MTRTALLDDFSTCVKVEIIYCMFPKVSYIKHVLEIEYQITKRNKT